MQFTGDNKKLKGKRTTVVNGKPKYNVDFPKNNMDVHVVLFYINSFPPMISQVRLRKKLKVCGMLTHIYFSGYRNSKGNVLGFLSL